MAGNIYLHLDGIPGESTAKSFYNWIDIASFSIGCAMEVDAEARTGSGGGSSGSADPEDFSFDKKMDWATPTLLSCCASGAVIPSGRLVQCNVVNKQIMPVSDYAIGDIIVTSCNLSGSGGGIPDESLTLAYGSIIWQYHCYSHTNPSKFYKSTFKEWSIVSQDTANADANTKNAFSSITSNSTQAHSTLVAPGFSETPLPAGAMGPL